MNTKRIVWLALAVIAVCLLGMAGAQEEAGQIADENEAIESEAFLFLTSGENGSVNVESVLKTFASDSNESVETTGTINLDAVGDEQRQPLLEELFSGPVNVTGSAKFFNANLTSITNNGSVDFIEARFLIQPEGGEPIKLFLSERVPADFKNQPA